MARKLPLGDVFKWAKTPGYWESFRFTYGSYKNAAKAMHVSPAFLQRVARANAQRDYVPKDETALKLQKALTHVSPRKLKVAEKYASKARAHFTRVQLERIIPKSVKTKAGQDYFIEQVEKYRANRPPHYTGGSYVDKATGQGMSEKEYLRLYRAKHAASIRKSKARYRATHREEILLKAKRYRQKVKRESQKVQGVKRYTSNQAAKTRAANLRRFGRRRN